MNDQFDDDDDDDDDEAEETPMMTYNIKTTAGPN